MWGMVELMIFTFRMRWRVWRVGHQGADPCSHRGGQNSHEARRTKVWFANQRPRWQMWAALAPTETTARAEMTRSPTRGQIAPQLLDNGNRGEPNHEHRAALEAAAMRKTNTEDQESVVDLGRRRRSGVPEAEDFVKESRQRFDLRRGEREMRNPPSGVVGAMVMVRARPGMATGLPREGLTWSREATWSRVSPRRMRCRRGQFPGR